MNEKYTNREISWLSFNERVLQEAMDKTNPIINRFRFLGIFSNNLDEFFKVRVASIKRMVEVNSHIYADELPGEILPQLQSKVLQLQKKFEETYQELLLELETHNIFMVNEKEVTKSQHAYLRNYFYEKIFPSLSPVILSKKRDLPYLKDKSIYIAVRARHKNNSETSRFIIIEVPTSDTGRFIILPRCGEKKYIILLEDVIRLFLPQIFSTFHFNSFESYIFKITRDAELDIDNDFSKGIIEKISKSLSNRKQNMPVRIVFENSMPDDMYMFFLKKLKLSGIDSIIPGGRYHNFKDFINFPNLGDSNLEEPKLKPLIHPDIIPGDSIFSVLDKKDILLHYPYHDFSQLIALLREAALDPSVTTIKTTIYRVAYDSKVVNALINAAQNGKEVTVLIELQARFDEKANIYWAEKLQKTGVKVIFGVPGLKTHSKIIYIRRKSGNTKSSYALIGTGNLHEGTAKVYTDVHLITAQYDIAEDVNKLFKFFESNYLRNKYKHLIVSPYDTRSQIKKLIIFETEQARKNEKAEIIIKINNIVDREIIDLLYKASDAGVKIKLIARGMCSVVPGMKFSKNIETISIVDRFLEHSRLLYFYHGGEEKIYLTSADLMVRNLDHRIEVTCPIYSPELKKELKEILLSSFKDNVKARIIDKELTNKYREGNGNEPFRLQEEIYKYYKNKSEINKTFVQKLFS